MNCQNETEGLGNMLSIDQMDKDWPAEEEEIRRLRSESYQRTKKGKFDEAIALGVQSLEIAKEYQAKKCSSAGCRCILADTYLNLAQVYSAAGKHEEAMMCASIGINIWMKIVRICCDSDSLAHLALALRGRERIYIRAGLIELASCDEKMREKLNLSLGRVENENGMEIASILGDKNRLTRIRAEVDQAYAEGYLGRLFPEDHAEYEQTRAADYLH